MHTASPVRSAKPDVIQQLTIFGDTEEIPINPPKKAPSPEKQPARSTPAIHTLQPAARKPAAVPTDDLDSFLSSVFPGGRIDDGQAVDLEAITAGDDPETIMAKRMFLRMLWDIAPKRESSMNTDLFGQTSNTNQSEQDKLDALVWLYGLNPDGSLVPFEWVCDVLGFDHHRVRRIVGRSTRQELKRLVNLLSTIVSECHARLCVETLSSYVDVTNWKFS